MKKVVPSVNYLFIHIVSLIFLAVGIEAKAEQVLLMDDFNRANTPILGTPWIEANESTVFTEFTQTSPTFFERVIGPGFIEITENKLGFHYQTSIESTNITQPYVYALRPPRPNSY